LTAPVEVLLYGRPDCHLCGEAREEIRRLAEERGWDLELREVDIEDDDELFKRYLEKIPVIVVDGALVSELLLDSDALIRRIATVAADG
jgi:glutaredoxin